MLKKFLLVLLILILLILSGSQMAQPLLVSCLGEPYVLGADIPRMINDSDTIVLARVENTLPAERKDDSDIQYVETPANLKVIQSLKGNCKAGDIFRIYQPGGVAGGIEYVDSSSYIHKNGETYLFFLENGYILDSEHAVNGCITEEGYFFNGATTDKAASIIGDCIKTGKLKIEKNDIKSFSFEEFTGERDIIYSIDRTKLQAQISYDMDYHTPYKTEEWDNVKWDSFTSDLEKCGVFNWKKYYMDTYEQGSPYWDVEIGYLEKIITMDQKHTPITGIRL